MPVSVLERPIGHVLGDCVTATINEAYAGFATVNYSGHGLSDGDYVYIQSNVESYNGFWYVNIEDGNKFKIRQYATATDQAYVTDATITYCPATTTHGWQCVHLPIAYRLKSDIYPTNNVDTSRTISSFNNDNGYVNLNLSGSLDSGPYPEPYEFIKISGSTSGLMDGVYQIVEVVSSTSITINLAYHSSYSFGSATVIRYYNNYTISVRVYAGLNSSHYWMSKKPYALIGTIHLVPDDNNEVYFSINEMLKSYVETKNNLTLDTLPNNLDAFTQFYITYAESYDDSLGSQYMLSTYTSDFTSDGDNFEGVAVNAKLPFKNQYSGHLSEYYQSAKFLTLFTSPIKISSAYHDVSVLITDDSTNYKVDVSGSQTNLETYDKGVYRIPVSSQGVYSIYSGVTQLSEEITFETRTDCTNQTLTLSWLNYLGGFDYWDFTAEKDYTIDISDSGEFKTNIFNNWPKSYGAFADTITKQTFRVSKNGLFVRSQYVTEAELNAIVHIKTSPLVQIITSRTNRRTVLIDTDSFTFKKDRQDLYEISFNLLYTDEIPSQRV